MISTCAEESFSNVRTVKAFSTEKHEVTKYKFGSDAVYKVGVIKTVWYGIFNFVATFFVYTSVAITLILGAKLYEDGVMTLGDVTSFLFYLL